MDNRLQAVGMIEFNSIAGGIEGADFMVKAALVEPFMMKTICPGKFVVAVHGEVASVQASVDAGLEYGKDTVIDHFVIPNITMEVITAIGGSIGDFRQAAALGVIETFSAASCVVAADAAAKAAEVDVLDVRLAMGLGGKAFCLLSGDVGAVEQAVAAGTAMAAAQGLLVRQVVIPGVAPEVLRYIL
ncbi:MAG TPA: BMC domain-containing protein [Desulfobacterales bacterium]|nr:BMC domain-containing protein [Desulfobacterales bacterium]